MGFRRNIALIMLLLRLVPLVPMVPLLPACGAETVPLPLPCDTANPSVASVLYVLETKLPSGLFRPTETFAVDGCAGFQAPVDRSTRITALLTGAPLTAMGLREGAIPAPSSSGRTPPCDRWTRTTVSGSESGSGSVWSTPNDERPNFDFPAELPILEPSACLGMNTCDSTCVEMTACGRAVLCSPACLAANAEDIACAAAAAPPPKVSFSRTPTETATSVTLSTTSTLYGRVSNLRSDNAEACLEVSGRPSDAVNGRGSCDKPTNWRVMVPRAGGQSWYFDANTWSLELSRVGDTFPAPYTYFGFWRNTETGAQDMATFTVE